jgi:hypothetical protein
MHANTWAARTITAARGLAPVRGDPAAAQQARLGAREHADGSGTSRC